MKFLRTIPGLILLLACLLLPSLSMAGGGPCQEGLKNGKKKKIMAGLKFFRQECNKPPYKAHIVEIDLTSKKFEFFVTPYKQRRLIPSKFAERFKAVVAVNGGFWVPRGGYTVSGRDLWPKHGDNEEVTVVGFGKYDKKEGRIKVDIRPTEEVLTTVPAWMDHALTGVPLILDNGKPLTCKHEIFNARHPRTGIGYTKDGKKAWLVVVDGRQKNWSLGLKTAQLGELFLELGAHHALNLDGGSSSTLVIPSMGGLINKTCFKKGPERNVPNHLGIIKTGKAAATSWLRRFLAFLFPSKWMV